MSELDLISNELDAHKGDFVSLIQGIGFDTLARLELDQRQLCSTTVFGECSQQVKHWLNWQLLAIKDEVARRFTINTRPAGLVGLDGGRLV